MASRGISPGSEPRPRQLGDDMRQGQSKTMTLPHGLASSMKQGASIADANNPAGLGAAMRQGTSKK